MPESLEAINSCASLIKELIKLDGEEFDDVSGITVGNTLRPPMVLRKS